MSPAFKHLDAFIAIGYHLDAPEGDFDPREEGAYWMGKDFSSISPEDFARLAGDGHEEIAGWVQQADLFYFFGPVVRDKSFVPEKAAVVEVPAAEYAAFPVPVSASFQELNANIRSAWKEAYSWLESSAWTQAGQAFEYYLSDRTYIYIPVVKKGEA